MGKYSVITFEERKKFITEVIENKKQLKRTASIMNIKLSTAKSILRMFRITGKILEKKTPKQETINEIPDNTLLPLREQRKLQKQSMKEGLQQDFPISYVQNNQIYNMNSSLTFQNYLFWNQYWWSCMNGAMI